MFEESLLDELDQQLVAQGVTFQAVVIGAGALRLLGHITRRTRDLDVLDPELPKHVVAAVLKVSQRHKSVDGDWLNAGPRSLVDVLPSGWRSRCRPLYAKEALELLTLGRGDLLCTKLFAMCDRSGFDREDCLAMRPTPKELEDAYPWVAAQDAHPDWPRHVRQQLDLLIQRLNHAP